MSRITRNHTIITLYICSKGAWMGVFAAVVMIVVLVLSVMMLLGTATPDRFETSKSKCLIIPHEH